MATDSGNRFGFHKEIHRRAFLRFGATGASLFLGHGLCLRAPAGVTDGDGGKSAIVIYLQGGPSHLDTYDLKPQAPSEFRGNYRPIPTNVPGIQICELMPLQARIMDKMALIRSVTSINEHSDALVMTGFSEAENEKIPHPSFGAVVSKVQSGSSNPVPPFVCFYDSRFAGAGGGTRRGPEPGFLGPAHRAYIPEGRGLADLTLPPGVDWKRIKERQSILSQFDSLRRDIDGSGIMEGLDSFNVRAVHMLASGRVRKALDLSREDPRTRDRYRGVEQYLLARRLIEAGVRCVTLRAGGNWDAHRGIYDDCPKLIPLYDRGLSNLVQDLCARGMERDVVVLAWGEFGRSPRITREIPSAAPGRDHWPEAMSVLVAGGGLKMGQVIGSTSSRGEFPKDQPYRAPQVLSTIYRVLGIDPALTFPSLSGRPMHILDDRRPVQELL